MTTRPRRRARRRGLVVNNSRFRVLRDARCGHGLRHRQPFVLACAAVATLMGSSGYQAFEDTCKKFTQVRALGCHQDHAGHYAAPSDSTFFRVLTRLDAAHFDAVVGAWLLEQEVSVLERLALDGKVLRGSGRSDGQPLQLFSAVSHRLRLTLAQVPIEEKRNEIPALPPLLRSLPSLVGTLITANAMHCQQESARVITQELGGDYLFGLKGNQTRILERAARRLAQQAFPPDEAVSWEKGHQRRERVEMGRNTKPPSDESSYDVTSLRATQMSDAELLQTFRDHWNAIENGAHHRRDVSFGEDASGVSQRGAAQVLACRRNLALGGGMSWRGSAVARQRPAPKPTGGR